MPASKPRTASPTSLRERAEGLLGFDHYRDFAEREASLKATAGVAAAAEGRGTAHRRPWRLRQEQHPDECLRHRWRPDRLRGRPLEPQAGPFHARQSPADPGAAGAARAAARLRPP